METTELSRILLEAKRRKGLSFEQLATMVGTAELQVAAILYGGNSPSEEVAEKLTEVLGLSEFVKRALLADPSRRPRTGAHVMPADPLLYRFYEILAVYGLPLKDLIQEKFGDGFVSDFTVDVKKHADPTGGDRVLLTVDGKFLPHRR